MYSFTRSFVRSFFVSLSLLALMAVYDRKLLNIACLADLLELNVTVNIVSQVLCRSGIK